jgi:F5/8 type C domain
LRPRDDDAIEVHPLAPDDWDYFAIDELPYRGRRLSILWDRDGQRYKRGAGLQILADGHSLARTPRLERLTANLVPIMPAPRRSPARNLAVNNDGDYYPKVTASFSNDATPIAKVVDGNYWYHIQPPNRWTSEGSKADSDWVALEFGVPRRIDTVKLYPLDDGERIAAPSRIDLEFWDGTRWAVIPGQLRSPSEPTGHRANVITFSERTITKLRAVLTHRPGARSGLTELEAWGDGAQSIAPAPPPAGNLAYNPGDRPFPKISASFTSRFDKVERANDGKTVFAPAPNNRWTSYESPNASDWLEVDFGVPKDIGRIELAIYDDHGGVQAPADYRVEAWDDNINAWIAVKSPTKSPSQPVGGQYNQIHFDRVRTAKVRVVFVHRGPARSGVSEMLVWPV